MEDMIWSWPLSRSFLDWVQLCHALLKRPSPTHPPRRVCVTPICFLLEQNQATQLDPASNARALVSGWKNSLPNSHLLLDFHEDDSLVLIPLFQKQVIDEIKAGESFFSPDIEAPYPPDPKIQLRTTAGCKVHIIVRLAEGKQARLLISIIKREATR